MTSGKLSPRSACPHIGPAFIPCDLALAIFSEPLETALRENFDASKSFDASFHRQPIQRDFAFATLVAYFPPPLLTRFTDASLRLATRFAQTGATPEELERARAAALTRFEQDQKHDAWWLREVVSTAQSRPAVLDAFRSRRSDLAALTLDEINAAAKLLAPDQATTLDLLPPPPPAPPR